MLHSIFILYPLILPYTPLILYRLFILFILYSIPFYRTNQTPNIKDINIMVIGIECMNHMSDRSLSIGGSTDFARIL